MTRFSPPSATVTHHAGRSGGLTLPPDPDPVQQVPAFSAADERPTWVVSRRSPVLADAALLDQKAVQFIQNGGTDEASRKIQDVLVAFATLTRRQII